MVRECSRALSGHHLAAALLVAGCGAAEPSRPPILVIALDALSAPYLGCYGGPPNASPRIDALARDAVLFENAYSQSASTVTSTASLLTGRRGISEDVFAGGTLEGSLPTLPELVAARGYHTAAIVGNPFAGAPQLGLHRGYRELHLVYAEPELQGRRPVEKTNRFTVPLPEDLNRHALALVERIAAAPEPPSFGYVHYLQPHKPYDPPERYLAEFTRLDADPGWDWLHRHFERAQRTGEAPPLAVELIEARYRANLRYQDDAVGVLLDALRRSGLYDDALIVLLSDHGEAFMKHGTFGHNRTLYDDMTRIPLLLKFPAHDRVAPRRVSALAETVDVTATLLDYLGIPAPPGLEGESLLPVAFGRARVLLEPEVVTATARRSQRAIRAGGHKYILHEDGREELYDLDADPDEQRDLADARPERARELRARLEALAPRAGARSTAESLARLRGDPETRELLETLGYGGAEIGDAGPKPAPPAPLSE